MPTVISIPDFSFVSTQYAPPANCNDIPTLCIPVSNFADLAWQLKVVSRTPPGEDEEYSYYAVATKEPCAATELESYTPQFIGDYYELEDNADYEGLIHFTGSDDTEWPDDIAVGDCFRIFIYQDLLDCETRPCSVIERTKLYCSVCFQRVDDTCFLSRLVYSCNENSFGFIYKDGAIVDGYVAADIPNVVLLPFYLKEPTNTSDSDELVLSDQSIVKLFEVIQEVWTIETAALPYDILRKLKVAFAHDNVDIYNSNMQQEAPVLGNTFVITDWETNPFRKPSKLQKASAKATLATAVNLRNLNC
jgi:hypothetical protein